MFPFSLKRFECSVTRKPLYKFICIKLTSWLNASTVSFLSFEVVVEGQHKDAIILSHKCHPNLAPEAELISHSGSRSDTSSSDALTPVHTFILVSLNILLWLRGDLSDPQVASMCQRPQRKRGLNSLHSGDQIQYERWSVFLNEHLGPLR